MILQSFLIFLIFLIGTISLAQTPGEILTVEFDKHPGLSRSEGLPSNTIVYRNQDGTANLSCDGTEYSNLSEKFSPYLSFKSCTESNGDRLYLNPMYRDPEHPNGAVPFSANEDVTSLCKYLTGEESIEAVDWTFYGALSGGNDINDESGDRGTLFQYKNVSTARVNGHGNFVGLIQGSTNKRNGLIRSITCRVPPPPKVRYHHRDYDDGGWAGVWTPPVYVPGPQYTGGGVCSDWRLCDNSRDGTEADGRH